MMPLIEKGTKDHMTHDLCVVLQKNYWLRRMRGSITLSTRDASLSTTWMINLKWSVLMYVKVFGRRLLILWCLGHVLFRGFIDDPLDKSSCSFRPAVEFTKLSDPQKTFKSSIMKKNGFLPLLSFTLPNSSRGKEKVGTYNIFDTCRTKL